MVQGESSPSFAHALIELWIFLYEPNNGAMSLFVIEARGSPKEDRLVYRVIREGKMVGRDVQHLERERRGGTGDIQVELMRIYKLACRV